MTIQTLTDELLGEIEADARYGSGFVAPGTAIDLVDELRTLRAENKSLQESIDDPDFAPKYSRRLIEQLRAENAELRAVVKDVRWRVWDTTDQLQAYSHNGDRLYGLDEWSVPIRNLNLAVGILDTAMEQVK